MNYLAESVMSAGLVSISEDRDIDMADNLMRINKIRHLPVVNANSELSGILSAKDVARIKDKKKPIKSIMTAPVQIVKKTEDIKLVIELMLKHKICSVLVANNENIVGIITTDDLLMLLQKIIGNDMDFEAIETASFFDDSWRSHA